jgi:hypothetical protein
MVDVRSLEGGIVDIEGVELLELTMQGCSRCKIFRSWNSRH